MNFCLLELATEPIKPIPKSDALHYLKRGGLIEILQSNMDDKNHRRTWLTRDSLGNPVFTFVAERGLVGGAPVPSFALHEVRISSQKVDEVLTFLKSFDLSKNEEAKLVVDAIGIAR